MFREGQAIFFLAILRFLADLRICFVKELLGLTLNKTTARKKYNPENLLTDTGYADDLSLLSNTFKDAQEFLTMQA